MSITFFTDKQEINMCNSNAYTLLELTGREKDDCGSIEGGEVELFSISLKSLLKIIQENPSEFSSKTIQSKGAMGATIIDCGTTPEYWERICKRLIELTNNTSSIHWG